MLNMSDMPWVTAWTTGKPVLAYISVW
jgi:hypothetical protein